jgi:hypothetical protein
MCIVRALEIRRTDGAAGGGDDMDGKPTEGVEGPLQRVGAPLLRHRAEAEQHDGRRVVEFPWELDRLRTLLRSQHGCPVDHVRPAGGWFAIEGAEGIDVDQITGAPELIEVSHGVESGLQPHVALHAEVGPPTVHDPVHEGVHHHHGRTPEPRCDLQGGTEHGIDYHHVRSGPVHNIHKFLAHRRRARVAEHRWQRMEREPIEVRAGVIQHGG